MNARHLAAVLRRLRRYNTTHELGRRPVRLAQ
jgi:hypothetical protein